jgi:hypothetical protein
MSFVLFCGWSNWWIFAFWVMLIPLTLTMCISAKITTEDPIFLYSKNRIEESKASLKIMARWNRTEAGLA